MRRWAFYLSVALLAFAVSVLAAFKLREGQKEITYEINTKSSENLVANVGRLKPIVEHKSRYTCGDKDVLNLRRQLKTDEILERKEQNTDTDCSEIYRIKRVDLNDDGIDEIIIKGDSYETCHNRGNCDLWVFQKIKDDYRMILSDDWTFDFEVQTKTIRGYKNLLVDRNSSNGNPAGYVSIFKFNGKNYQEKDCFSEEWIRNTTKTKLVRYSCRD